MRFVIIGDSKGKEGGINKKVLARILNKTDKLYPKPEFFVMLGDSVAGSRIPEILAAQLIMLRKLIERYHPNIPIIPVAGNHEVNVTSTDGRYEKILSEIYCDFTPDGILQNYNRTVYYKDFSETRLIILNAFHYGKMHKIDKEQLDWLEQAASANKKSKIVFVHSPAFPTGAHLGHCLDLYPACRDAFWNIIDKYRIDIVFSGHEHNYSRRIVNNSFNDGENNFRNCVCQVITGGGGEKLKSKYKSREGVIVPPIDKYHFVVVDIIAGTIDVSAISSEGKKMDQFKIVK
ncbi:MAG TPA: calcineurin [Clostridiaceae bacterium]|nr:calcineurin [Clostridiaceae bacterium]